MQFAMDGVKRQIGGEVLDLRRPQVSAEVVDGIRRISAPVLATPAAVFDTQVPDFVIAAPDRRAWWWLMAVPAVASIVLVARFGLNIRLARAVTGSQAPAVTYTAPQPKPIVPATFNLDPKLEQSLSEFSAAQPVPVGIVAKDLKTGKYALLNADKVFTSASLYKLFVANQILHRHDYEGLSLSAPAGGGTDRSIQSCLQVMINVSDNGCGWALGTMLGWGKQNPILKSEGYINTDLTGPYQKTSAGDVAKLLEQLYTTEFLKPISNNLFMQHLKDQRVNDRLPTGIPAGLDIAHKTGDLEGNMHDAGIVYGTKTDYLVVMLSGPWQTPSDSRAAFKDLSTKLYAYFNN